MSGNIYDRLGAIRKYQTHIYIRDGLRKSSLANRKTDIKTMTQDTDKNLGTDL